MMIQLATPVELIEDYISEKTMLTAGSRKQYTYVLRRFYRWVKQNALEPQNLKIRDLTAYYRTMDGFSDLTKYGHFTVLKNHFRWVEANSLGVNNLKDGHPLARLPRRYNVFRKNFLSADQVRDLLNQPDTATLTGKRDFAMMHLLVFNGIRLVEVCRANWQDVSEDGQGLLIQRKGRQSKDELIRLSLPVQQAINDYLVERPNLRPESPLIASHAWNHTKDFRFNTDTASRIIKGYLRNIGLKGKTYTAHSLRHTAASMLLQMGVSPHDLQRYLGHANFSTSQLYLRAIDEGRIYQENLGQKIADIIYNSRKSANLTTIYDNDKNSPFLERPNNFKSKR